VASVAAAVRPSAPAPMIAASYRTLSFPGGTVLFRESQDTRMRKGRKPDVSALG
jgi:hypothetical protein